MQLEEGCLWVESCCINQTQGHLCRSHFLPLGGNICYGPSWGHFLFCIGSSSLVLLPSSSPYARVSTTSLSEATSANCYSPCSLFFMDVFSSTSDLVLVSAFRGPHLIHQTFCVWWLTNLLDQSSKGWQMSEDTLLQTQKTVYTSHYKRIDRLQEEQPAKTYFKLTRGTHKDHEL